MRTAIRSTAIAVAVCMLAGASPSLAASYKHRGAAAHWTTHRHAQAGPRAWALDPRFAPYAYSPPAAFGLRPGSEAEERWFDQARGNIW